MRTNGDLWRDLKDWPKKRIAIEGMQDMWYYLIHFLDMKHINIHPCFLLRSFQPFGGTWLGRWIVRWCLTICCIASKQLTSTLLLLQKHSRESQLNSLTDKSVNAVNHVDSVKRSTKVPDVRSSPHSAEELEYSDCMIELEEEEADSDVETEVCDRCQWIDCYY